MMVDSNAFRDWRGSASTAAKSKVISMLDPTELLPMDQFAQLHRQRAFPFVRYFLLGMQYRGNTRHSKSASGPSAANAKKSLMKSPWEVISLGRGFWSITDSDTETAGSVL